MPQQEVFFEQVTGDRRMQVLKTYDSAYAREVFDEMDDDAQTVLWNSLDIEQTYDAADLPSPDAPDRADFLWDELLDAAREDVRLNPNLRSFFGCERNPKRRAAKPLCFARLAERRELRKEPDGKSQLDLREHICDDANTGMDRGRTGGENF